MTAVADTPTQVRRFAGKIVIAVLVAVLVALAVGSFVLGRVTRADNASTISPVRTVYLHTTGGARENCRVHAPC